jgi:hypothetical protein
MGFFDDTIPRYKTPFRAACRNGDMETANSIAMSAAEDVLRRGDEAAGRAILWKEFFSVLDKRYISQYQSYDFEIADYQMFAALPNTVLFRGPRPTPAALANGNYILFLGAAQLFGRFHPAGPHEIVAGALGLEALNLSMGGAGPEFFLGEELLAAANASKAVVLQVLSGRSIGCDEYPGMRMTTRHGDNSGKKIDRLALLNEIWWQDPREAIRLVGKWRANYLELMHDLLNKIQVPVVLTWISTRSPEAWSPAKLEAGPDFGEFPQLVDSTMMNEIAARCARVVVVSHDAGVPFGFVSRFTGEKCPFYWPPGEPKWQNVYYPSASLQDELMPKLISSLQEII